MPHSSSREYITQAVNNLAPPPRVKAIINNLILGNLKEVDKISPVCGWFASHPEITLLIISLYRCKSFEFENYQEEESRQFKKFDCHKDEFENILNFFKDYLLIEKQMIEEGIISERLEYLVDYKLQNYKCIQGVFFIIEKQGYIKKIDYRKSQQRKLISHHQAVTAFKKRYKLRRFKTHSERYKKECIERAIDRLPIINELYQKREDYFYNLAPNNL
jgi:hypothetical protein